MSALKMTPRTPAETVLIERAENTAAVADAHRQGALEALRSQGLPSRRVEAWHYTDLRALMGRIVPQPKEAADQSATFLAPFLPHSIVVDLGSAPASNDLAAGITVSVGDGTLDWTESVNHLDRSFDTIRMINTALGARGSKIAIADGARVEAPIELRPEPQASGSQSFAAVTLGKGSKALIVERASGGLGGAVSSAVSRLDLGENAEILWIIVQEKGTSETHLGQLNVTLGTNAKLRLFVLNAGGAVVRQEIHAETVGEGADIQIRGVNLMHDGQHIDVTSTLNHNVAHTTSTEIFRNIVTGGHCVFQGMIRVAKGAQKTDARLACNTLLLSDDGEFSAKPELEIFADDVQCGHGATAGEINADHLFYLMSRGIPESQARALLVKAFVAEVVEDLEHEAAIEALEERIDVWLAAER